METWGSCLGAVWESVTKMFLVSAVVICLLLFFTYLSRGDPYLGDERFGAINLEFNPYENGSVQYGDESIPVHGVRVDFDLFNIGPKRSLSVITVLSYYNKTFSGRPMTKHQAATDRVDDLTLDRSQIVEPYYDPHTGLYSHHIMYRKHMEVDFDISHLAQAIHDGYTHPSVFVVEVFVEDSQGNLERTRSWGR